MPPIIPLYGTAGWSILERKCSAWNQWNALISDFWALTEVAEVMLLCTCAFSARNENIKE